MTLSEELKWRGFINQTTIKDLSLLDSKKLTFYHGYDASADSLTIGNLAAIMMDKVFIRHGWKPVILSGGATSMVGDPGGKDSERKLQSQEQIYKNVAGVTKQIKHLFDSDVTFVNNLDWYKDFNILDFLRDVGKNFSMTPLLQRDYIAKRIGEGGSGITYTEFSYTLLQGYDFLHLFRNYDVRIQLAGSDQWGNSLSGVDLVRRVEGTEVDVFTCPLIINHATGKKFGKSEDGAIWLDKNRTSAYAYYQFWLNIDDAGVETYLKIYTELAKSQIDEIMTKFNQDPAERLAQKTLAFESTKLVHGLEVANSVKRASQVLFEKGQDYSNLKAEDFLALKQDLPIIEANMDVPILKTLVQTGSLASNSEARRYLDQGALYVNGNKLDTDRLWQKEDVINNHAIIRCGKNKNIVVQFGGQ